jgi:hypothetical protein
MWSPVKYVTVLVAFAAGGLIARPVNAVRRALRRR